METHDEHHKLPLLQTALALAVITIIELIISELEGEFITYLLLALTFVKGLLIASVFMEVAYDKDTTRIVLYVFVVPFVAVLLLLLAINSDWRTAVVA